MSVSSVLTSALPSFLSSSWSPSLPFFSPHLPFRLISSCHLPFIPPSLKQTSISLEWYFSTSLFASGTLPLSFLLLCCVCSFQEDHISFIVLILILIQYYDNIINFTRDFLLDTHTYSSCFEDCTDRLCTHTATE